jgi:phosphoglucosamine mutase
MMGRLFGTDGIRGVAGAPPLDAGTIYRVGRSLTEELHPRNHRPLILLGRDTRESGPWIEEILTRAILDAGGDAESCGVISTPAISYLTRTLSAQAGIMISASHNPYRDNGIKIFSRHGTKFGDGVEDELESRAKAVRDVPALPRPGDEPSRAVAATASALHLPRYLDYLRGCLPDGFTLRGSRIAVDCAHGALSGIAPAFLRSFGAEVFALHCAPDGRNINRAAGALHPEALRRAVADAGATLGIAFDGDADRAIFVDETGQVRDGDDILYLFARHLDLEGGPKLIVGTVMANLGLEVALREEGFELSRTAVGDRYVLEEMLRRGALVGGEQSGHVILSRFSVTGDGLLTSLKVLEILRDTGGTLSELCLGLRRFPQVLRNVTVRERIPFPEIRGLPEAEEECRRSLGRNSRILLRYSGTENLARVMVEGEDPEAVHRAADSLAAFFEGSSGERE